MPTALDFITNLGRASKLAATGRYHFTTHEVVEALGVSMIAARASLRRLKHKGRLADPHRGFHVIVPPEYRHLGGLPAEQFVPQLMEHLGEGCYAALLSAAELCRRPLESAVF